MAIACLRLLTFLPERPDFSSPRFISCIARFTFFPAFAPYLRFEPFFRPELFLRVELFFLDEDFFRDFLVAAIHDLPLVAHVQRPRLFGVVIRRKAVVCRQVYAVPAFRALVLPAHGHRSAGFTEDLSHDDAVLALS